MPFLTFNTADIQFIKKELIQRSCTTTEVLPTIKQLEHIKAALNKNSKTFVIHLASFNLNLVLVSVHPDKKTQIAFFLIKKVKIPDKYLHFINVFSEKKALVLPKRTEFNQLTMNLKKGKQPPYGLIYNLGLVELKTLKAYIKTHLKTGFIQSSKSSIDVLILFNKKPDGSFRLYVNY